LTMRFYFRMQLVAWLVLFVLAGANVCGNAQSTDSLDSSENLAAGSVRGTVLDANGAIVPGATIVLQHAAGANGLTCGILPALATEIVVALLIPISFPASPKH
jgi:hypothetical protein